MKTQILSIVGLVMTLAASSAQADRIYRCQAVHPSGNMVMDIYVETTSTGSLTANAVFGNGFNVYDGPVKKSLTSDGVYTLYKGNSRKFKLYIELTPKKKMGQVYVEHDIGESIETREVTYYGFYMEGQDSHADMSANGECYLQKKM